MARITENVWKCVEMAVLAGYGWKLQKLAVNGCKWLEWL